MNRGDQSNIFQIGGLEFKEKKNYSHFFFFSGIGGGGGVVDHGPSQSPLSSSLVT
jgi:hypothetical protein